MKRFVRLEPILSFSTYIHEGELVAFDVGPDGLVYLVLALEPLDFRYEAPSGASFAKVVSDHAQRYRVLAWQGTDCLLDVLIEGEPFNIHNVQPILHQEELLLVCSRCSYRGPDDCDLNGRVYSQQGKFQRAILLGDGIQSVQSDARGQVWTSYFDEGVLGNYGWSQPLGASGLVAWDLTGKKQFEYRHPDSELSVLDCYALNVASDRDVWLYYYTEFPLVHLRDHQIQQTWKMPIAGSSAFAIDQNHALFSGGYKKRDEYLLFQLGADGKVKRSGKFQLRNADREVIAADRIVGRGNSLYLLQGDMLYVLSVADTLAE